MTASFCCFMTCFVKFAQLSAEVASVICVGIIVGLSAKNPFKSHVIGKIENYYNYPYEYNEIPSLEDTTQNIIINESLIMEKTSNDTLSDEILIEDTKKISPLIFIYQNYFKRKT